MTSNLIQTRKKSSNFTQSPRRVRNYSVHLKWSHHVLNKATVNDLVAELNRFSVRNVQWSLWSKILTSAGPIAVLLQTISNGILKCFPLFRLVRLLALPILEDFIRKHKRFYKDFYLMDCNDNSHFVALFFSKECIMK